MCASPRRASRRRALLRAVVLLGLLALAGAFTVPRLASFLLCEDPLAPADAIVVLAGARADRWLEAIDLYRESYAPRIVVSQGEPDGAERALRARGIELPSQVDVIRRVMGELGLSGDAVSVLPGEPASTAEEAVLVRDVAEEAGWRRVLLVTSKLHTRRARLAFRRELAGTGIVVMVRASRYDDTDVAHWWRRRRDLRDTLLETLKLAAYALGLGA